MPESFRRAYDAIRDYFYRTRHPADEPYVLMDYAVDERDAMTLTLDGRGFTAADLRAIADIMDATKVQT